jgi:hypothetical protein
MPMRFLPIPLHDPSEQVEGNIYMCIICTSPEAERVRICYASDGLRVLVDAAAFLAGGGFRSNPAGSTVHSATYLNKMKTSEIIIS